MNITNQMSALFIILFSYFLGSFPSGYLAGKWIKNIDLREIGSGSTGATNVLRHVGKIPALFVFAIDLLKGFIPIIIAKWLNLDEMYQVTAGIASLTGHIWPIWLKGRGGKAVATGLGVFLGLSWQVGLATLGIFLLVMALTRIVSLASILSAISLPILMYLSFGVEEISIAYVIVSVLSMLLVIWRHRTNINRLIKRKEPRIGSPN
tara:strand:+ start:667 stop:1287 length:621 start_codon:yes stop_codon:yes gene_type:complete